MCRVSIVIPIVSKLSTRSVSVAGDEKSLPLIIKCCVWHCQTISFLHVANNGRSKCGRSEILSIKQLLSVNFGPNTRHCIGADPTIVCSVPDDTSNNVIDISHGGIGTEKLHFVNAKWSSKHFNFWSFIINCSTYFFYLSMFLQYIFIFCIL